MNKDISLSKEELLNQLLEALTRLTIVEEELSVIYEWASDQPFDLEEVLDAYMSD